jgi:predicted RNase H-like nuclease (RuvC/YqgF family)
VVDPAKVRVATEIGSVATLDKLHSTKVIGYESHAAHDVIALRRELVRVRGQLADETHHLTSRIAALEAALTEATAATKQACHDKDDADDARQEEARRYHQQVEELTQEISRLQQQFTSAFHQTSELETELANIRASRSWRLTRPYRAVGSGLANVFRKALQKSYRPQELARR